MQTVLLTGANSGLGLETARQLSRQDYRVILACRNLEKAEQTRSRLLVEYPPANLQSLALDLSSLSSVQAAVAQLETPPDTLICNAGLSYNGPTRYTAEGVELTFGVNHLGHFALTTGLLHKFPRQLKKVLVVASEVHNPTKKGPFPPPQFSSIQELMYPADSPSGEQKGSLRYVHSKLCNLFFTYELHRRWQEPGFCVKAFNPGFIPTTGLGREAKGFTRFMMRHILPHMGLFIKGIRTVEQSASDLIAVCFEQAQCGLYFDGREAIASSDLSYDRELAHELWEESESVCHATV